MNKERAELTVEVQKEIVQNARDFLLKQAKHAENRKLDDGEVSAALTGAMIEVAVKTAQIAGVPAALLFDTFRVYLEGYYPNTVHAVSLDCESCPHSGHCTNLNNAGSPNNEPN